MNREWLEAVYFQNSLRHYLTAFALFLLGAALLHLFRRVLLARLKRWALATETLLDDFLIQEIESRLQPLLYYGAFYTALYHLTVAPRLHRLFALTGLVLLIFYGVRFLLSLLSFTAHAYWIDRESDPGRRKALSAVLPVAKVLLWSLAAVLFLDNLGIKISTLVAGLGIGGVAVALASQAVLGDLFSYFTIFFDRPFEVGDTVHVGDFIGTVEKIGIKSTRLRSLGGEQLVFSNTDLTNSRIRNYKRMERRRVVFKFSVTYQTPGEDLKALPGLVAEIVRGIDGAEHDRAHLFSFGDSGLVFEAVYYVLGSDYNRYMDIQQAINLKILEEFARRKISFAYPTQSVRLEKL